MMLATYPISVGSRDERLKTKASDRPKKPLSAGIGEGELRQREVGERDEGEKWVITSLLR